MVYDASDPLHQEKVSISIPGIDRLMVIGHTPAALEFSSSINQIARFDNLYHCKDVESAVEMLKAVKVSLVIIDGDSDFDPVSCSRLIRVQNSVARIILISTRLGHENIINMKNNGVFHGFIQLPCDSLLAHTIIMQEQAKYHINQTLKLMLVDSSSRKYLLRHLKQSSLEKSGQTPFSLIDVSIVYETLSVYNYVIDQSFELDPILFSSYFSAISIFSESIINKASTLESFEFNKQVVFVKTIDEVQYIFVFNNVHESNRRSVEGMVNAIAQRIYLTLGELIKATHTIHDDEEMQQLIEIDLPPHQKENFLEAEQKAQIINIHEPNPILAEFYDETARAYEVHYVDNEEQLFDMINDGTYDIVIINEFETDFQWNKYMLNIVKEESNYTQSIGVIRDKDESDLSSILNVNDLDLVIDEYFTKDQYYLIFKRAIDRSKSIQDGIIISDLNQIYRLKNQPELLKARLRQTAREDDNRQPKFSQLFIMVDNEKFYGHTGGDTSRHKINEGLFFGFIDSLLTFTDELRNSPIMFSGIKYGSSNIIVHAKKEYYFIYFIDELDHTTIDAVTAVLNRTTAEIYEELRYDVNPHALSDGLNLILDEICSEINSKLIAHNY